MNKQFLKVGLVALMAGMYSAGASAASVNGDADATIITPIVLAQTAAMNFGTISPGTVSSTITVDNADGRTLATGDASLVGGAGATSGAFTINGSNAVAYTMTLTTDAVLTDAAGANPLTMLAASLTVTQPALTGAAVPFTIGGTLTVPSGHPAGSYSTTNAAGVPFTVTANYN